MSKRELRLQRNKLTTWILSLEKIKTLRNKMSSTAYDYIMQDYDHYNEQLTEINAQLQESRLT